VVEGPDRHEQRERGHRQKPDLNPMPPRLKGDAHEEVGPGDVARAHDQRRDRRLHVPGEPVPRVVGEEVQQRERDEQERHDHGTQQPCFREDTIVTHGRYRYSGLG
jgi:hypothetical protein